MRSTGLKLDLWRVGKGCCEAVDSIDSTFFSKPTSIRLVGTVPYVKVGFKIFVYSNPQALGALPDLLQCHSRARNSFGLASAKRLSYFGCVFAKKSARSMLCLLVESTIGRADS